MTASELSLFSTVNYQGTYAVIIKIKDTGALLYDASSGWLSYPIPASQLTLVSRWTAPSGTPSNLENAPLYSGAFVQGKQGYIIDKREVLNEWTNEYYRAALVYFQDAETGDWYSETEITFTSGGTPPGTEPGTQPPVQASSWSGLLKWGGILGVGYLLLKGNKKREPSA